uniref:FAD-binding PCMH-type domain-containing protein n=1 Tax=Bionectria ochroleuca TaxID=29856 RepID=A0A0B7K4I8_BIOOC
MRFAPLLSAVLGAIAASALPQQQNLYELFTSPENAWHRDTILSFPGSPAFYNATLRWTPSANPQYFAAISPANEADVAKAVRLASNAGIPFLAQGGRHGIAAQLNTLRNGLAIDLSKLNFVSVNRRAATAHIGGGARFRDIFGPVGDAGFHLQTGSGSCPGVMGVALGAGVGRYQGMFGLVLDNLLSARLVTAEGKIVDVSKSQNPDLFWAIRGAGANFGIVTSAVFKLNKAPNGGQVLNADFIIPAASNSSYMDLLQTLERMPPELATISFVLWNETISQPQILANWVYTGPREQGMRLIDPIFRLNPVRSEIKMVAWKDLVGTAGFGIDGLYCQPSNTQFTQISTNVRRLDAKTFKTMFEKMNNFYRRVPAARASSIELEIFNTDAAKRVLRDETAYPWRDTIGYTMYEWSWTTAEAREECIKMGNELLRDFVATSGYPDVSVYVNYASGNETVEQKFGKDKLPRLASLKRKWDPRNAFRWTNPLPTNPATEVDVVAIVKFATVHNIPFIATGGHHGYSTNLGKLVKGLAIDLSLLNSVEVFTGNSTLVVGGGTRWGQILDPVYEAGFEMRVVGTTIGGGIGRYSGRYGMISDSLTSANVVTADGRLVKVSETLNSDLFWGIRGAGASFGIITQATYKLWRVDRQNLVMNADFVLNSDMSNSYFDLLESYDTSMTENLAIVSMIIYNEKTNAAHILANWVYLGQEEEGLGAIKPLLELQPSISSVSMVPWNKLLASQGLGIVDTMFCQNNQTRSLYSANVRRFPASTSKIAFEKMEKLYAEYPSARASSLSLEMFPNQAAMAQGSDATAYPWRDARGNITDALELSTRLGQSIRDAFAKTSEYHQLSVYVSYAHGDESLEQVFGIEKLPRLTALKKKWDSQNAFGYSHALPTEHPPIRALVL